MADDITRGLRFSEYRSFYELANSRSMRKAADALHIAPSALSRQIKKIEELLGESILERGKSGVRLTIAGELLLQHIKESFASEERLRTKLAEVKGLRRGRIVVACGEGFLPDVLGSTLERFARTYPGITLNVVVTGTDGILKAVIEEEAELGIAFCPPADERILTIASCRQPLYAIVPPRHQLCARASITLAELAEHSLALHPSTHGVRQIIDSVARESRIRVLPRFTANSTIALKSFAERFGAATVLRRVAAMPEITDGALVAIPLKEKSFLNTEVELITRRDRDLTLAAAELSRVLTAGMLAFGAAG